MPSFEQDKKNKLAAPSSPDPLFSGFIQDARLRFPALTKLLLIDSKHQHVYGTNPEDSDYAGWLKYLQQELNVKRRRDFRDNDISYTTAIDYRPDGPPKRGFIAFQTRSESESSALNELDHELAHLAIQDGYGGLLGECVADAYMLIRHYQRHGTDAENTIEYDIRASGRADNLIMHGSTGHFTSFVHEAIRACRNTIDYMHLDAEETAKLARKFAREYMPSATVIEDLVNDFKPVNEAFKKSSYEGLLAVIKVTLDPMANPATFKTGSIWLREKFGKRDADGKPLGTELWLTPDVRKEIAKALQEIKDRSTGDTLFTPDSIYGTPRELCTMISDVLRIYEDTETPGQSGQPGKILIVNSDVGAANGSAPLAEARIEDIATYVETKAEPSFTLQDLVNHSDLMASLALPGVGQNNLGAIWERNIKSLTQEDLESADPALDIAENNSYLGLGITSLQASFNTAANELETTLVHVIVNNSTHKTLIVSESVPSSLSEAFQKAGITHIDRHAPNAAEQVKAGINDLLEGLSNQARLHSYLTAAFAYRNDVSQEGTPATLEHMLVDDKIEPLFAKYVVKGKSPSM